MSDRMRGTRSKAAIEKRKKAFGGRNRGDIARAGERKRSALLLRSAEHPAERPQTETHYISKVLADAMGVKLPPGAIGATLYGARWTAVLKPEVETAPAQAVWLAWARWSRFKPFNSYWQCRCCLATWWDGEREQHLNPCALQRAKPE